MGISTDQLLVVGDFRFDIIAGKEAGTKTALLTNGGEPVQIAGDPQPDHVISGLEEIRKLL